MRIMAREHRAVIGAILEGRYRRDPDISQHETVSGRAHNGVGVQSKRRPAKTPPPITASFKWRLHDTTRRTTGFPSEVTTSWRYTVAEWLACWTRVQKGPGSSRSRDAVG